MKKKKFKKEIEELRKEVTRQREMIDILSDKYNIIENTAKDNTQIFLYSYLLNDEELSRAKKLIGCTQEQKGGDE